MNGDLAIRGLLNAATGLTALVGHRIDSDVMATGPAGAPTYPAVTFQRMSGSSAKGALSDPPLMTAVFQVSAWASSRKDARLVATQIRAALDRKRQITVSGVYINDCFYQDDIDLFDFDTRTFFTHVTFRIHYRDPS
jgi:hypothetical protein